MKIFLIIIIIMAVIATSVFRGKKILNGLKRLWKWIFAPGMARPQGDTGSRPLTVSLGEAGSVTLSVDVDITRASREDREFISGLIDTMHKQMKKSE